MAPASVWHRGRSTSRVAVQDHRPSLRIQGLGDVRAQWARSWAASMFAVWSRWRSRNPEALKRPTADKTAGCLERVAMSNSIARLVSGTGHLPNRTYLRPESGNASSNYSGLSFGPNSVRSKIHPLGHVRPVAAASRCTRSGEAPRLSAHRLHFGTVHDHHIQATPQPTRPPISSPSSANQT